MPRAQLLLKTLLVQEASHLEERRFYEAHQIFNRPFLLGLLRPTQPDSHAHFQHGVGEDGIPFGYLAVPPPLQSHRLRSVEHAQQGNTAPTVKMFGQVPHQALHRFVLHQSNANVSRVFQARSEEVNSINPAIEEFNVHLSKVVLAKFPWQTLKTDQRLYSFRSQRSHQSIQGGLATWITSFANSPEDFQRRQVRLFF